MSFVAVGTIGSTGTLLLHVEDLMMTRRRSLLWVAVLAGLVVAQLSSSQQAAARDPAPPQTAFDHYIAKPDASYAWKIEKVTKGEGYTTYVIDLKSQSWRSEPEVDRSLWEHWLTIVKPDGVQSKTAMLLISGGGNKNPAPGDAAGMIRQLAVGSKSVVAELKQVPNQPLVFHQDGKKRVEDDLIAYTWVKQMDTGDPTWTARMPMVKSAVRAMDTIQAVLASDEGGKLPIDNFVVAGASKRGWTTWLTGAVDKRVVAIIPIVIDILNVRTSMQHHHDAYGFWAPAIGDYVRHKITDMTDRPEYLKLLAIEDPYSYIDRLTMPKYIINATGDEFFLPDGSQFYFAELKGEKYLRYVPNAKHSLDGSDAVQSVLSFYQTVLAGKPRPKFSWTFADDGSIHVSTVDKPKQVNLWQATNEKARDFRLDTIGRAYSSSELSAASDGKYVAQVPKPSAGWTSFFVELVYDSGFEHPLKFTTAVRVTPDVLPFKSAPAASN